METLRPEYPTGTNDVPCVRRLLSRLYARLKQPITGCGRPYGPELLQQNLDGHGIQLGLGCLQKRKFKAITDSGHGLPVADNLLSQDFHLGRRPMPSD